MLSHPCEVDRMNEDYALLVEKYFAPASYLVSCTFTLLHWIREYERKDEGIGLEYRIKV